MGLFSPKSDAPAQVAAGNNPLEVLLAAHPTVQLKVEHLASTTEAMHTANYALSQRQQQARDALGQAKGDKQRLIGDGHGTYDDIGPDGYRDASGAGHYGNVPRSAVVMADNRIAAAQREYDRTVVQSDASRARSSIISKTATAAVERITLLARENPRRKLTIIEPDVVLKKGQAAADFVADEEAKWAAARQAIRDVQATRLPKEMVKQAIISELDKAAEQGKPSVHIADTRVKASSTHIVWPTAGFPGIPWDSRSGVPPTYDDGHALAVWLNRDRIAEQLMADVDAQYEGVMEVLAPADRQRRIEELTEAKMVIEYRIAAAVWRAIRDGDDTIWFPAKLSPEAVLGIEV